ncbi:MAG: hypothetical protein V2A34_05175 [Lentisphaerota bacterium]
MSTAQNISRRPWLVALAIALMAAGIPLTMLSLAAEPAAEGLPTAKLQQLFLEASQAYNAGRPLDAAALYKQLMDQGYAPRELLYNMGNAFFKAGKLGEASLYYRRAWYLSPRDPDIRANLSFALQNAGASAPDYLMPVKILHKLSLSEWSMLGMLSYWLACGFLAAFILRPFNRQLLQKGIVLFAGLTVLSLAGIGSWLQLYAHPEVVVIATGQKALSGPVNDSVALFTVAPGSLVLEKNEREAWTEILLDKQTGWIPSASCKKVVDWNTLKSSAYP